MFGRPWTCVSVCIPASAHGRVSSVRAQVVLWAECFQLAKRHVYSASSLKRKWLVGYLVTVTVLYILLITLYSLFLVSTTSTRAILDAIYSILGFFDLAVPLALIASYVCLTFMYSGFPTQYVVCVCGSACEGERV